MEKIWLQQYEPNVPAEISVNHYQSLANLFEMSCDKFAELPAYENFGTTITYAELKAKAFAFAAYLQNELHVKKGDRLALMMPNILQYPICLFGGLLAGVSIVNINPLYTARELHFQLKDSCAKTLVVLENMADIASEGIKKTNIEHIIIAKIGDCLKFPKSYVADFVLKYIKKAIPKWQLPNARFFKDVLEERHSQKFSPVALTHDDIAFIQYTGGTTGVAKGAILTNRNMLANITQALAWLQHHVKEKEEIVITALPLYHIFSLTANCLLFISLGALNVLITNPRDTKQFVKILSKFKFTLITGVNTLFNLLLHTKGFEKLDFSHLKISLAGGMSLQRSVALQWHKVTQCVLLEAYGLSETSPAVAINPLNLKKYNGYIGLPLPSTDVKVCDEQGNELPIGQAGELYVKGPQVMRGYWNNPLETQRVLSSDGWLKTGDIACFNDQGFIKIVDRKKDMILVSGFNVYPNEIEDIVVAHQDVLEAAAIGVPDDRSGEVVKLYVVKKNPELTTNSLMDYCRKNLTGYKLPKYIEFRESLPKTNVGKILRKALRQEEEEILKQRIG